MFILKPLILLFVFVVIFQMYNYATTREKVEKQKICRGMGIALFSVGVVSLVLRDQFLVFSGLVLMMIGFRLIAHGLDRLDKKIYIDRYDPPPDE